MNHLLSHNIIAHNLLSVSLQAGILALLAFLAERLFRNAPPSFRYWLWMLVVIRLAAPVDFAVPFGMRGEIREGFVTVVERFSSREKPVAPPVTAPPVRETPVPVNAPAIKPLPETASAEITPQYRPSLGEIVALSWAAISALLLLSLFARSAVIRRRLMRSRPIYRPDLITLVYRFRCGMNILRPVKLMRADAGLLHSPAVTGLFRPRIWIPGAMAVSWTPEGLEPVLLHELAHIRRNDLLLNWLLVFLQAVWFFHPLIWLANSRIRKAREEICDDMAVLYLRSERERYSLSLIRVGEECIQQRRFPLAEVGFSESKSSLGARVRRIMDGKYSPHRRMRAGTVLVMCLIVAMGAALACERTDNNGDDKRKPNIATEPYNSLNTGQPTIMLGGRINAVEGSFQAMLDGKALTLGIDYTVDYQSGKMAVLTKDALNPMSSITIQYRIKSKPRKSFWGMFSRIKSPPAMEF
ncbi:MAG: M56 family metallopeptidase, partial [Candidatus Latescibacterota bacterium]